MFFLFHKVSNFLSGHLRTDPFPDSNRSRRDSGWHSSSSDPQVHITFDFMDANGIKVNGTQHSYVHCAQEYNKKYNFIREALLAKIPVVKTNQLGSSQPPEDSEGFAKVAAWFPRPALDIGLESPFIFDDMNPILLGTPIQAY